MHFNPLPSCEGRPAPFFLFQRTSDISIHSPHARGDRCASDRLHNINAISIHSPHARGDHGRRKTIAAFEFQSTPLMRGETIGVEIKTTSSFTFQSTPLMRGETSERHVRFRGLQISIHSPHARGDGVVVERVLDGAISIHSPHARGDATPAHATPAAEHISIHSPHARGDKRC